MVRPDPRTLQAEPYDGPPAPWDLHGSLHVSLWTLPPGQVPDLSGLAAQVDPIRIAGRIVLVTAWAHYTPPGTLAYRELMQGVAVRRPGGLLPACTVERIWVDDATAAQGGRSLWAIPKEMASFEDVSPHDSAPSQAMAARVPADGRLLAELVFDPGAALPFRTGAALRVVQPGHGSAVQTRCVVSGQARHGRARWRFPADSPLVFLSGRAPFASMRLDNLHARFGV